MLRAVVDPDAIRPYLADASGLKGSAEAVFRPRNAEEVAELLREATARGTPVTVSAGRTSTTGAAVPDGGWVLTTEALSAPIQTDGERFIAGAGRFLGEIQDHLAAQRRFFPPDPTSRMESTLGGAVACNASGARTFRYGPTRAWISAVEVVLPSGDILQVRRGDPVPKGLTLPTWEPPRVKCAAGYVPPRDALDLFIGHEGTLGVVTKVEGNTTELREYFSVLAFFPNRAAAVAAMRVARIGARQGAALAPRALEYLDGASLALAAGRVGGIPRGAGAALFCEQELMRDEDEHLSAWLSWLEEHSPWADDAILATDARGQEALRLLRHAVPAALAERLARTGFPKIGTDFSVPDGALDAMLAAYEAAPFPKVIFGHLGDNHLHVNLLPETEEAYFRAKAHYREMAMLAVALGGAISGEHGIGRLKRALLAQWLGPDVIRQFKALKSALDPAWILGRGVMLEPDF